MPNLVAYSYWICLVLFVLFISGILCNLKHSFSLFKGISKRTWIVLIILLILSLCIRLYFIPHRHYVFYDEYEHINIAKNLVETRQFSRCDFYLDNKCLSSFLPQWVPGYHFILSLVFKIFGISEYIAFNFNVFLGTVSVLILFLLTYLISSVSAIALISAALLSVTPLHLIYSGNSSLEMCSLTFILLSVFSLLVFIKLQTKNSFFQLLTVLAYTILVRVENGIILLLFALLLVFEKINFRKFLKLSFLVVIFLPALFYLPNIKAYMDTYWLKGQASLSMPSLLMQNILFWFDNLAAPLSCTLLAIGGVYLSRKDKNKLYPFLILYFFTFLFIYTFLHKAEINTGDTQRYNLQFYFPVIIFASIGIYGIIRFLAGMQKLKWITACILFFALVFNFSDTYLNSQYFKPYGKFHIFQKQYEQFLNAKEIDPGCVFIDYNPPSVITTLGRSSVHISHIFDEVVYSYYLKNRCLVFINDDSWCERDKEDRCSALKSKFVMEKVESKCNADLGMFDYLKTK